MHKIILMTLGLLISGPRFAEEFKRDWEGVPGATAYEFEIVQGGKFLPDNMVRQGTQKETKLVVDLGAGVYLFRMRAVDADGRPGKWSTPEKILVKAPPPKINLPKANEVIEVPRAGSNIQFEWSTVEGSTDYELKLSQKGVKPITKLSPAPYLGVNELAAGKWQAQVVARSDGQTIAESEAVPFEVSIKPLAKPRILTPLDGDILPAHEINRIRWMRSLPGERAEIKVTRLGEKNGVISREPVEDANQGYVLPLVPGRYQITIKTFLAATDEGSESSVTINVEADPLGMSRAYTGVTWKWLNVSLLFGPRTHHSVYTGDTDVPITGMLPSMEPRVMGKIWGPWGAEAFAGVTNMSAEYGDPYTRAPLKITRFAGPQFSAGLGPTYKFEPLGPTKPVWAKVLVYGEERKVLGYLDPSKSLTTAFRVFGFELGADFRYGGWNTRWDIFTSVMSRVPLVVDGLLIGTGSVAPIPSLRLQALFRRRFWDDYRWFVGGTLSLEKLAISEDRQATDSSYSAIQYGPTFGIEWDL